MNRAELTHEICNVLNSKGMPISLAGGVARCIVAEMSDSMIENRETLIAHLEKIRNSLTKVIMNITLSKSTVYE